MGIEARFVPGPTSPAHDFYQLMFETTDVFSLFWQPYLKGVGRWQLELAHLGAKQGQAFMEYGRRVTQSRDPMQAVEAQMTLCNELGRLYTDAGQHVAQAITRAAQPVASVELFPAQKPRTHDMMRLEDWFVPERRVA
jgi:hypothetical protein